MGAPESPAVAETLPPAFDAWFASRRPEIPLAGARAVLELAAAGASAPFIAAWRRQRTGGLDARAVRLVIEDAELFRKTLSRQAIILESIERHATLAPELRERILASFDPDALEDLYHPFRQQKKNRALAAREAGLQPLADWIWDCGHGRDTPQPGQTLELWAFTFRDEAKGVKDARAAIEGARDILVERLAGAPELRELVRRSYFDQAFLHAARGPKARDGSRFEPCFDFHEKVAALREPQAALRYLALRRGQAEDELQLSLGAPPADSEFEARLVAAFEAAACTVPDSPGAEVLRHAGRIAFRNDVRTAIENEVHRALKDAADAVVVAGFAEGLRRRLLEAPFGARPVVGADPGPRGACRLAAVGATGALAASLTLELASDEQKARGADEIVAFVRSHAAEAIAIGDGGGGRELQLVVRAALRAAGLELPVVLVSEAGASGWAASEAARAELPDVEPALRAAASLARRLQDPLGELVRLDPKALANGPHHHDVAHALLQKAAAAVIEDAVADVGVDVNLASRALLCRVPGLGPSLAAAIVERRAANGRFTARRALGEVPGLTPLVFEQCAGFLRVRDGEQPLDATAVHPEHYPALEALAARYGKTVGELVGAGAALVRDASELDAEWGALVRAEVAQALEQAGRDPRPAFSAFAFRDDVRGIADLKPGMLCPGLVTNVTGFGVFVDIGARQDGLVHVSQLAAKDDGKGAFQPGDRVEVRVLKVDLDKKQVSLSMKPRPERRPSGPPRKPRPRAEPGGAAAGSAKPGRPAAATGPGARSDRPRPARRPDRPRPTAGERPARGGDASGAPRVPRDRPAPERRPEPKRSEPRRQAFNNPFAVLAGLKKNDKS
jgi:uncharacterized protein